MDFAEKKEAYLRMQHEKHLEADRDMLAKKSPNDSALTTGVIDKERAQREILWALLDVASVEEIISNRITPEEIYKIKFSEQFKAIQMDATSGKFSKIELISFNDRLSNLLSAGDTPDEFKMEVHALSGYLESEIKFHEFNEKLLAVDFLTVKQPELAGIARGLKIDSPDYKLATLRPIMEEYRANLPKVSESHSDQVIDQMNADASEGSAIEELEGKVEELESENEDLQEQLEDAETEKELLEDQLEEEKKSEASPDPV